MPQGTYGKEGVGLSPGFITHPRALVASAVSTHTKGQCPTTLIHLGLGPKHDPFVKIVTDQIRMWLYIVDQAQPIRVAKAWWAMFSFFYTAQCPWSSIKGPMGATIATLDLIG